MSTETSKNSRHPELAHDAPEGPRRQRIVLLSLAVLVAQLLVPASYYIGERDADERFAWRMFSNRRAETCKVQATERRATDPEGASRRLRLSGLIHRAWIHGLSRRRPGIVDKFFSWRCEEPEVRSITLIRRCRSATGEPMPPDEIEHRCERAP